MEFGDSVIGRAVRQPGWSHCVVIIEDVGEHSFWGKLHDIKANETFAGEYVGFYKDDWVFALEVNDIISNQN
jgi:hypothetical protein